MADAARRDSHGGREAIDPASSRRRRMVSALCFAVASWRRGRRRSRACRSGSVAALLVGFGAVCLAPDALILLTRCTPRLGGWGGVETRLATANIAGAVPRLSISVAALSVSLAMLVAIAVMIGSFRETVILVSQTLHADLFIATGRRSNLDAQPTISAALSRSSPRTRTSRLSSGSRSHAPAPRSADSSWARGLPVLLEHGAPVCKALRDGVPVACATRLATTSSWSRSHLPTASSRRRQHD